MNDDQMPAWANQHRPWPKTTSRNSVLALLCIAILVTLSLSAPFSPAQTSMVLIRWKEFSYAKQSNQVGGHITAMNAVHRTGYITLGDGKFARLSGSIVHADSPEGKEFYQGFVMYDFPDGSSILAKVDATGGLGGKQVGAIVFLAGTKRFKGITGRGTVTSWMPAKWDMYAEIEASYSVRKD